MAKKTVEACAAIIEEDGRFLVAQRMPDDSFGGLWEFPGGGVDDGEAREDALAREIREELGVDISVGELFMSLKSTSPSRVLNLHLFTARIINGTPRPIECSEFKWMDLNELKRIDMIPLDRKVVSRIEKLRGRHGGE